MTASYSIDIENVGPIARYFRSSIGVEDRDMRRVGILLLQVLIPTVGLWYVFHDPQRRAQIADATGETSGRIWLILKRADVPKVAI
jgi:hypothetical protein